MLVLVAAGFQLALAPALLLMALQGATPAVGPASAAARLGIVSAAFPAANGGIALTQSVQVVVIATLATSIVSVAVSVIALAIVLRTVSPRRIAAHVRAAYRDARAGDRSIARYRSSSQNARSRPASAGASPSSGTASR
jgi:DNA-binding NarL/FixJ family response regulator